MNRVILVLALGCLFASMYFFFVQKDLFTGSVTMILSIVFNLIFAMMSNVNKTAGGNKK